MRRIRRSRQKLDSRDWLFYGIVYTIIVLSLVVTVYPFLYVFSISLSSVDAINRKLVFLYPVHITVSGYQLVFRFSVIWKAYYNTIWYTAVGTLFNMVATCLAAYPLARRRFFLRRFLNFFIVFTMFFSGGLIPTYIVITSLGLYNSRWAMVVPVLLSTFYVLICRSAFETVPAEIFEGASIDGANDLVILARIAVPLVKPTLAVLSLYYAIGHWNDFFNALLYLGNTNLAPLQIYLRRILLMASPEVMQQALLSASAATRAVSSLQVRYVSIVVSVVPIILAYPFVQKYFIRGILLGAVKG